MSKRIPHDAVSIEIAAPPAEVYALVSDITRMGEWSPECVRCTWTKGATGPAVGARFKAANKGGRGPAWRNTPVVTVADPDASSRSTAAVPASAPTPGATSSSRLRPAPS